MICNSRVSSTVVTLLVLLFVQLGPAASAQAQSLDVCKGHSPTGSAECSVVPQRVGPWRWSVPGPIQATPTFDTSDGATRAIDAYKTFLAGSVAALCGSVNVSVGALDTAWSQPSGWDFKRMLSNQRFPATFSYEVRLGTGTPQDPYTCSPRTVPTYLYSFRDLSCAYDQGWSYADSSASSFCMRASFEDLTCPTANPVLPGSGVKVLTSADYTGAGAHPLEFSRTYRSR